jgi:hypothetical protein
MRSQDESKPEEKDRDNHEDVGRVIGTCLFQARPCCPFPALSLFWKVTISVTAILMLVFSITLWTMAIAMGRYANEMHELRIAQASDHNAQMATLNSAKQTTLENRSIQSKIEGMISGWIEERRRYQRMEIEELERIGRRRK